MPTGSPLYLDTSVALRATLERGTTPEIEARIAAAPLLVTSRLSLVESSRALLRLRQQAGVTERVSPTRGASSKGSGLAANCGS
jgi:hypothetical protein